MDPSGSLARIASKRFESNEMLPVFQLPNEVLGIIASHLTPSAASPLKPKIYPIIALSQTCRRWRSVTMTPVCSPCWASIPLFNLHWMDLCLERSRSSLTFVCISSEDISSIASRATSLGRHMHRVSSLLVAASRYSDPIPDAVWPLLALDVPSLEELLLEFSTAGEPEHVQLPGSIFAGNAPATLKIVESLFCDLSQAPHVLRAPNLTELTLDQCTLWETKDHMFASFDAMPLLQEFHANECALIVNKDVPTSTHRPLRSIQMTRLDTLSINGGLDSAMTLFEVLAVPFTADIALKDAEWDLNDDNGRYAVCTRLVALLEAHLSPLLKARIPATELYIGARNDAEISWQYAIPTTFVQNHLDSLPPWFSSYDESSPISVTIAIEVDMSDADTERLFDLFVDAFLSKTTSMNLHALHYCPRRLSPFAQRLPELQSLQLDEASLSFLLPELYTNGPLLAQLPQLRELRVQDISLVKGFNFSCLQLSLPKGMIEDLRLVVKDCVVTASMIEELRSVAHVEWDGITKSTQ